MPAEPAPLSPAFSPSAAPARLGRAERIALVFLAALAVLLLAAWQIPPMLDWSRFRGVIATYAGARLGRPVTIAGQVRLTLLPRPMLLADKVSLPDRGDGLSVRLGTMRLEVALSSLLAGHIVPRALSLDDPQASLPWPPPRGTAPPMRAGLAGEFSATVTGGTLTIGGITLHDIAASLRTDPDTGAFSAQGNARVAGLPWRFTALLGAPGADGVATVSLTLDGLPAPRPATGAGAQPDMQGTGGAFYGRLRGDGTMLGALRLRGPDLSRLLPAPAAAWQVQGDVSADGLGLRAPALDLRLADSPGRADLVLRLAPPASLALQAHVGQVPAGPWMWRALQGWAVPGLAAQVDLGADGMPAGSAIVLSPHLRLSMDALGVAVRAASATLPGGTRVEGSGTIAPASARLSGQMHVAGTTLHPTLRWLAGPAIDRLPPGLLGAADLRGTISATPDRLAWSALSGHLDGAEVTGDLAAGLGARPSLGVALTTDRLSLPDWPLPWSVLATTSAAMDATIDLRAGQLAWRDLPLRHAVLQAGLTRAGLAVKRLALDVPGGHLEASGSLGAGGALSGGRLDLAAPDAQALPVPWRVAPALWQGGFHLALTGAGPPDNIAAELRADLGDLRVEAEAHVDAIAPRIRATATLRHPGAPRLLAALGVPGARAWLDDGSLAVLSHLVVSPGHVQASDFAASAGALQVGGRLDASVSPGHLTVNGTIDAATLALPGLPAFSALPAAWGWLRGVEGRIDIKAARVLMGLEPIATAASATVLAGGGAVLLQDGRASLPHGDIAGAVAVDATQDPPAVSLSAHAAGLVPQEVLPDIPSPPGITLRGGLMDLTADLDARGYGRTAWLATTSGDVHAFMHGTTLQGFDLTAAAVALRQGGAGLRGRLNAALSSGQTAPMDGGIDASLADGVARLTAGHLSGQPGSMDVAGSIDVAQRGLDLRLTAMPAVAVPPRLVLGVTGPWSMARSSVDLASGIAWAGAVPAGAKKAQGKDFFFEKKKQKTFSRLPHMKS